MSIHLHSFVMADPKKCIGCRVCEVACAVSHSNSQAKTVGDFNRNFVPRLYLVQTPEITMPVQCHHCEDAPCAKSCPVAAITEENNQIMMNEKSCIGCKSCVLACPFGAIELVSNPAFSEEKEESSVPNVIASKCDLCGARSSQPACVAACPKKALQIVDMDKIRKKRRLEAVSKMNGSSMVYRVGDRV